MWPKALSFLYKGNTVCMLYMLDAVFKKKPAQEKNGNTQQKTDL